LAERDGWKEWSSPEIANINRSIDSLASLIYLRDLLSPTEIEAEVRQLLLEFKPSIKRRVKYRVLTPLLRAEIIFRNIFKGNGAEFDQRSLRLYGRIDLYKFIAKTWHIVSIRNLIDLITYIASLNNFVKLESRFMFWKSSLSELDRRS
jgi:hypothetical protein